MRWRRKKRKAQHNVKMQVSRPLTTTDEYSRMHYECADLERSISKVDAALRSVLLTLVDEAQTRRSIFQEFESLEDFLNTLSAFTRK